MKTSLNVLIPVLCWNKEMMNTGKILRQIYKRLFPHSVYLILKATLRCWRWNRVMSEPSTPSTMHLLICYSNVKLSVTLQKETFSVLSFKFNIFLVLKLFHSCWRPHPARCKAPSTPAMSIKEVFSIQGSQDSVYFTRSATFVKVHLTIYISMIQLRQCIKHQLTDPPKLIAVAFSLPF